MGELRNFCTTRVKKCRNKNHKVISCNTHFHEGGVPKLHTQKDATSNFCAFENTSAQSSTPQACPVSDTYFTWNTIPYGFAVKVNECTIILSKIKVCMVVLRLLTIYMSYVNVDFHKCRFCILPLIQVLSIFT